MQVGVATFAAEGAIEPHDLGHAVEERGFDALFLGEHTHMPASRPPDAPGSLPWYYYRPLDPFLALSAAAVSTNRITLGTAICLVVQHDPITLAKEVASIDALSHGRFQFGIGAGWQTGGDRQPRHRPCDARRAVPRTRARDEGHLDL